MSGEPYRPSKQSRMMAKVPPRAAFSGLWIEKVSEMRNIQPQIKEPAQGAFCVSYEEGEAEEEYQGICKPAGKGACPGGCCTPRCPPPTMPAPPTGDGHEQAHGAGKGGVLGLLSHVGGGVVANLGGEERR